MALIVNLIMTVANRRENTLYVSVWYVLGAVLWTAGVYPIGNVMWHPATGAMPGLMDSILLWFYGHNIVGLLLTPLALAAAYFVIPRLTKTPLYSHTLSLLGFWMLVALYAHIGGHHILQAPIPNWLKTISIVDSMAMILPVSIVLVNLWMTARGREGLLWSDPAGRFVVAGTIWYLIVCTQGPLQSLPSVQKITHFTNWTIGHSHIAVLGFAGFIALGGMWHVLPLAAGRRLYSSRLVHLQFALILFGLIGFFAVLTTAGLIQGSAWYQGEGVYKTLAADRRVHGAPGAARPVHHRRRGDRTLQRDPDREARRTARVLGAGGEAKTMKMTPALVVIGSLMVFWCSVIIAIVLPAVTMNEKPSELWRAWSARGGRRPRPLRPERVQLLPFAVHPRGGLRPRLASGSRRRAITSATPPRSSAPSASAPTSRRPAASIPTTGTSRISPTRATRGRCR